MTPALRAYWVTARQIGDVLASMATLIENRYRTDPRPDARDAACEIAAGLRGASAEAMRFTERLPDE